MKLLAYILVALVLVVVGTLAAIEDNGYVLIARAPWSIEMPLTLFLLLLVVTVIVFYIAGWMAIRTWTIPETLASWRQGRKARKARRSLNEGLLQLATGDWLLAESHLLGQLRFSDVPVINYLGAAVAAQHRGEIEKRDEYLAEAQKLSGQNGSAVACVQARLQLVSGQYEQALATLTELRDTAPDQAYATLLLAHCYKALRDWASLAAIMAEIRRHKSLPEPELAQLEIEAHDQLLRLPVPAGSAHVLQQAWEAVPKALRQNVRLICTYTKGLANNNQHDAAESLLRKTIESDWAECLLEAYSQVRSSNLEKQLNTCQHWEQEQPSSAALQLCLGQINVARGYLDTAVKHLEKAIKLNAGVDNYAALAAVMEKQGHTGKAMDAYRKALELCRR